jgi:hypothetical protein
LRIDGFFEIGKGGFLVQLKQAVCCKD